MVGLGLLIDEILKFASLILKTSPINSASHSSPTALHQIYFTKPKRSLSNATSMSHKE